MGISLPRPEHRFRAQGLRPGLAITLHVESGETVPNSITLVDEIGEERIAILRSMSKTANDPLPAGAPVRVTYHHEGRRWGFDSTVLASHHLELEFLVMPETIEPAERREAYRLSTALKPVELFRLVVQGSDGTDLARASTVVDVSELGVCLSSRAPIAEGERLGIRFELPGQGEIVARMVVRSIQPPAPGLRNNRVRCEFLSLPADTRAAIARFVMARQAELSRTGQL